MTCLIVSTLQITFLNPETGRVKGHDDQLPWDLQRQRGRARWQNFSSTDVSTLDSHTWAKHKMHRSISQEHDACLIIFSWDLLCPSSLPLPFLFTCQSYLLLLSLPCAISMPNCFPNLKNTSLFSPYSSHFLLSSPFPLGDFHFFNPIFFTQETISLNLPNLQQNQAKLFYTNDLQHRNICCISMYKHDLVMQKLSSLSSLCYLTLGVRATPRIHKSWSEITHLYIDRIPGLSVCQGSVQCCFWFCNSPKPTQAWGEGSVCPFQSYINKNDTHQLRSYVLEHDTYNQQCCHCAKAWFFFPLTQK